MKKKKIVLVSVGTFCLIVILILVIFLINRAKNYIVNYEIDGFKIEELYDKEMRSYHFFVEKGDLTLEVAKTNKWLHKKELVDEITTYESPDYNEACILLKSKHLELEPMCVKDDVSVDISFIEGDTTDFYKKSKVEEDKKTYKNIVINTALEKKFLIWVHNGYYSISHEKLIKNSNDDVNPTFLENESYYNKMAYQMDEFVLTPDYDQSYAFKDIYVFNFKNGTLSKWNLDIEISYNSYFLGDRDGYIYIFDRKNQTEYSLNPKKKAIEIVSESGVGKVYMDSWKEISTTKLAGTDYHFSNKTMFNYEIENEKLVLKYSESNRSILVSDKKPDVIVATHNDEVYYLVGDRLYMYSLKYGEILLLTYSEWTFNNMNAVFVY